MKANGLMFQICTFPLNLYSSLREKGEQERVIPTGRGGGASLNGTVHTINQQQENDPTRI